MWKRNPPPEQGTIEWEIKMRTEPFFWREELGRVEIRLVEIAIQIAAMKTKNKLRREAKQKTGYGWKGWRKWLKAKGGL
jgi:hypothetical protein